MAKASSVYHHFLKSLSHEACEYSWELDEVQPFNELIISWNGLRPNKGNLSIFVSLKFENWSLWGQYATWGAEGQSGGSFSLPDGAFVIDQDIVSVPKGKARGIRILVKADAKGELTNLHALHACASCIEDLQALKPLESLFAANLNIPPLSQMKLPHARANDICSPTSTSAALSYLLKKMVDPINFALHARDEACDIFGNWVLNLAEASAILGKQWTCWAERLSGLEEIAKRLRQNTPVIVSVRGPLPGSAQPYLHGHLVVVRGIDAQQVHCMDPAFLNEASTLTSYSLPDFMEAWSRRKYISYVFEKVTNPHVGGQ